MSKRGNGDKEVWRLKKDLKDIIDHRIDYNNGFANLLRGDYSLFIALSALFLSLYGAWKRGFLAPQYVLSLYLALLIWLLYSMRSFKKAFEKGEEEEWQEPPIIWGLRWTKPLFCSLWTLSLVCILVLLIIGEKSWWMWAPAILFAIFFPLLLRGAGTPVAAASATENTHTEKEKKRKTKVRTVIPAIIFILILAIALIYPYYCIIRDLIYNVLGPSYSFSEVILTIILILVCLASLSDYLSLKFIVADVSNQNYLLSLLRTEIDEIGDVETLMENREELLNLYLPKADSFLLFFEYYGIMFTGYTFEMGEEGEEEEWEEEGE